MDDEGGREMPRTVSENGSLNPPGKSITGATSSNEEREPSFKCELDLLVVTPMLEGFLRNTFDPGLSTVDADEPETREGVRVFAETSSLGRRDEEACREVLWVVDAEGERVDDPVGTEIVGRALTGTDVFGTGAR